MASRTPAEVLAAARQATSLRKRQQVLDAVRTMLDKGEHITFTAVARAAEVSTWLVYADGVRPHIDSAIQRQRRNPAVAQADGRRASTASLHTDLALVRQEIKALREERDRLRKAARQHLGDQLHHIGNRDLTERINELTQANRKLEREAAQLPALRGRVTELERDLDAARTSLRQMIRDGSQHKPS